MKVAGIYRITNLITGCVYVGSSFDLYKRLKNYTRKKLHCISDDIKESIIKHGIDNHEIRIMCEFDSDISQKELETYEDAFILLYLDRLGEEKILNSYCNDRKKWCSERYRKNLSVKSTGRLHNQESKNKISERQIGELNHMFGKRGKEIHNSVRVNQYTKDGIFIKTWDSIADVERNLGINHSHISSVCKGNRKTTGGFKWTYYNEKES